MILALIVAAVILGGLALVAVRWRGAGRHRSPQVFPGMPGPWTAAPRGIAGRHDPAVTRPRPARLLGPAATWRPPEDLARNELPQTPVIPGKLPQRPATLDISAQSAHDRRQRT